MRNERRWFSMLALMLALAALLAACGGQQQPQPPATGGGTGGETPSSGGPPIKIGAIFDLTGATADVGTPYSKGQIAFIEWKNANGGVAGRQLQLISQDYAYEVPRAEELYTQFVTQGRGGGVLRLGHRRH
jgi:branched-chain amino acid transport system substrate-binding protein